MDRFVAHVVMYHQGMDANPEKTWGRSGVEVLGKEVGVSHMAAD